MGGWNNNGGGWGNSGGTTREEISYGFDMNGLENGIRGVQNGLCDGFYSVNTSLLNGFHGVDNAVCTLGYQTAQLANGVQQTVQAGDNATQVALMQGFNGVQTGQTAIQTQIAQCCCDNKAALADLKYTMATDTCAVKTQLANSARDIIDNDNANYRAIDARLTAMEMAAKDDKIATLTAKVNSLELCASQQAQNAYLINELRPCAVPAYTVPNPYASYGPSCCNGYSSCC